MLKVFTVNRDSDNTIYKRFIFTRRSSCPGNLLSFARCCIVIVVVLVNKMKSLCLVVVAVVAAMVFIGVSPSEATPVTDQYIRDAVIEACLEDARSGYGPNGDDLVEISFAKDIEYQV